MGRLSSGSWFLDVGRVARAIGHELTGPQLTAALIQDRSTLSLAMSRRLSSAYRYAVSRSDDVVIGSIAVCEQLQAIERLDPAAVSDIIAPALAGRVPLSVLQARAVSVRARLSATCSDTMTTPALVKLCPEWEELGLRQGDIEYDHIRDSDWVVVEAAVYLIHEVETTDRRAFEYDGRWCLLVSPHIRCAKLKSSSHADFVSRIFMAAAFYARVSVMASSFYEREMVEKQLRRSRVWDRVTVHHLDEEAVREP